jgi:hypothetical protein
MVELKKKVRQFDFNSSQFCDRVISVLKTDGVDVAYGGFTSKVNRNGMTKVLKSLGLYKVTGRGVNRKMFVHPKIDIIIKTTLSDAETVAKTIMDLYDGKLINEMSEVINVDLSLYHNLPNDDVRRVSNGCGTYMLRNPKTNLIKIGRTKKLGKRVSTLSREFGIDLILIGWCELDFENIIHEDYKEKRVHGEWFKLTDDDMLDIYSDYQFITPSNS